MRAQPFLPLVAVVVGASVLQGCASSGRVQGSGVTQREEALPPHGAVRFEQLRAASAPGRAPATADPYFQRLAPVAYGEQTLPTVPEPMLAAGTARASVAVRVLVSTTGDVVDVTDSPLAASEIGPFAAELRRAVEDAVRSWRFHPATESRFQPGPDHDGDGKPDWEVLETRREVPWYFDLRFVFEVDAGVPSVRAATSPATP